VRTQLHSSSFTFNSLVTDLMLVVDHHAAFSSQCPLGDEVA
jgi:hypothetical protein